MLYDFSIELKRLDRRPYRFDGDLKRFYAGKQPDFH